MAYHDRSFDADFELFGMTPRSNLGLEQGDGFSFDGADWNDPTGQDDLGSSTQDFAAFEVPSGPTYQMEVRNNQEGVFDVQKAHDVHTTSQYVPDVQPSLSMQQCQQPGLEGWRPFECTVQDFDEIVHRPSIVGNTHEGHGTGHNQSLSFQQMNRDLMEITSAVPTPQLYDHRNVARQRRCSAPWTPYTMPDTLYGTTPRVSPDTGAVFGSSIPVSNEQPLFPHGSSPVDQRVSMSYTRDPNGSESAKSYYGMSIDSVPVGHRRPSVSLSRNSSTRLSVGEAPLSPALTVTPDFVEACLTCRQDRCYETFTGEFRRGNLARHIRNKHGGRSYPCGVRGCDKKFQRSDARLKHQRKYHLELNLLNPVPRR